MLVHYDGEPVHVCSGVRCSCGKCISCCAGDDPTDEEIEAVEDEEYQRLVDEMREEAGRADQA